MSYVNENQINVENTTVTAIEHLRRFRDIILCRGEDGTCCCSCPGCRKPRKSKKPGYRQNRAIAGENTVAGGSKQGKNVRERYNEIITVKETEEPRRRRDAENEESNSHYNEKKSKGRVSRRDKHEEKKAEKNVEKVEEKRLRGEAVSMDKHEEKKARTPFLKTVEKENERYPPDLDVDAVPEKMASVDFRSEVNTINVSGVHDRKSRKAMSKTQLEDENEDNVSPMKSEVKDNDVRKKQKDADEDNVSPVKSEVQDNDVRKKQRDENEDKVSPLKSEVQDNDVRKMQRDADEDKVSPVKSEVQDNDVRKMQRDENEDKVSPVKSEVQDNDVRKMQRDADEDKEGRSRRHRSEKEINSGKDEEQTIEDNKGQIMEKLSRNVGNENKERKKGEPSNKPIKEFEDAKESLVGNEGRLQAQNNVEILSYQESPVFSKQEESVVADIFEEEQKETRDKSKKKLSCTNVNEELKKLVKDETYRDQARKESLEAAEVPGHDPTFEINSKEGDLGKQNKKAADEPSEAEVSSVDVIHLSNETLSMTAGLGPVPVQALDASPTIKRRKSVTFDTNITKIHLYEPDDEEYSYYQENPTWRKFPDGQDDFAMNSSSYMNESQSVENLPFNTSHRETVSHLADSVLHPVNTATSKQDMNYQAILEITQKFVSLLKNEKGLKRAQSVVSKAVEPVNKDEGLHKNKLDMVFHEDKEDQKGYEYEEEEEVEEKVDYNTSSGHKGPSKYPGDENLHIRGSVVGHDDDDHVSIPSGHSNLIWPKELRDSEMATGQPGSIQAASSVQHPRSPESREPCDGTVHVRNITLPLNYDQDDQLAMYHGSTSMEEEAHQRDTDEGQDGRELWRTNLPPPLPKPDLLAPNPFPRRGNSLPVVRGPPSQTTLQATTISSHGRIKGKSDSLSKIPISDISHDLAKESARIPTTMPSMSRPFDPIQGSKLGEAHDVLFQPPSLPKPPVKNNFKEILAPINGSSPSPVLHDVLLRGKVPHSYPIPKPPPLPRQAWSERNVIHGVECGAWDIDGHTMTNIEEETYIHYPHPPTTPAPKIHQPHPPSTPVTSASSASHLRRRYMLRAPNVPGFQD